MATSSSTIGAIGPLPGAVPTSQSAAWVDRPVNPYRLAAIEEHAGQSLLDVGCGNGAYVMKLAGRMQTAGVDIQPFPSWDAAPQRFQVAPADALPFADNTFQTVTSFEVLEHVPEPAAALAEMARVAQQTVIVSVPNCQIPEPLQSSRLTFYHYTDRSHLHFFTLESLRDLAQQVGLRVRQATLINPTASDAVVADLLGVPRLAARAWLRLRRRHYYMTCLLVAEHA